MKRRIGRRHAELNSAAVTGAGEGEDLLRVNWMQLVYGSGELGLGLDAGSSAPDVVGQEGDEDEDEDQEHEGQAEGGEDDEARGARAGRLIADLFTRKRARRTKRDAQAANSVKLDAIDSTALCTSAPARDWQLPAVANFSINSA